MSNYLFWKTPLQDQVVDINFRAELAAGEVVSAVSILPVSPATDPALTVTSPDQYPTDILTVTLSGGVDSLAYGFQVQLTTQARVILLQCACTVQSNNIYAPYQTSNPTAYQDLIDELPIGSAVQARAFFTFPPEVDVGGGFVTWELLDQEGEVYNAGNAFSYEVKNNGTMNRVKAQAVITAPSTMPPTLLGQSYQIRWTLQLPPAVGTAPDVLTTGAAPQTTFYQFENVSVLGLTTVPLGVQPTSEIQGGMAHLQLCTDMLYDNVTLEIWAAGTRIAGPTPITENTRVADGWLFEAVVPTSGFKVSLIPYSVVWRYNPSTNPSLNYQETTELFIVNPTIMTAVMDVRAKIQKAGVTIYGTPDLLFPDPTILLWLRRGMDYFNGSYGQFTNLTMTNAQGPIREYWLLCAEKFALEAQYLAEGNKAFDFQGQAISLTVDQTQYLDNAIGKIQHILDSELKLVKSNMIRRGATNGDGSQDPSRLAVGAFGAVGVTITPANVWNSGYGRYNYGLMSVR